jgi:hypothetical protein
VSRVGDSLTVGSEGSGLSSAVLVQINGDERTEVLIALVDVSVAVDTAVLRTNQVRYSKHLTEAHLGRSVTSQGISRHAACGN